MQVSRLMEEFKELLGVRRQEFNQDLQASSDARRIMEEPLVQRFFAKAEESLTEAWKVSARDDTEYRERLYYFVGLTREYKEFFQYFLDSEAYALQQIKDMEEVE